MNLPAALLISAMVVAAFVENLFAQTSHYWRAFTTADGLPESACLTVTIGASGNILVRHPNTNLVSVLNGYEITHVPAPDASRSRIYESPGGQLWTVASDGLLEYWDGAWVLHRVPELAAQFRAGHTNAPMLCPVRQGRVLVLLVDQLLQFESESSDRDRVAVLLRADQTTLGTFTAMTPAADGGLWISGLRGYVKIDAPIRNLKPEVPWTATNILPPELESQQPGAIPVPASPVQQVFDSAAEPKGGFWLATAEGLFRYSPAIWKVLERPTPAQLESKDARNRRAKVLIAAPSALPVEIASHAEWKTFFVAEHGDVWLGGAQDIAWRHQNRWQVFASTNQLGPENVIAFAEAPDGRVWCATPDKVWEFDGKNWLGLRSGFDPVNALHGARNGNLWVATDKGLHRYTRGAWIANGPEDGLPAARVKQILEDEVGRLTAETAAGWSEFQPDADSDPPESFIQRASGDDASYREGETVMLTLAGRDKWKQTVAERLLFSHRLDEREWSPFQEHREVSFVDLPVGKHYFQVRAMDRNGNIDANPARLEFAVVAPWYRETRLVWILTIALAVAIFFAALAFNRHRRLQLSYAEVERQVAERTRELELANRELLHSQKMNALGALAAGIAHDFNNILSIVKGSAQIIEENLERPEKIRTRLDRIKLVVQQGAGIVEAMLGFSRSSDQTPAHCDVNAVVEDTVKLLGDRFLRETEVHFEQGEDLPEVSLPRDFVQQVLLNFIFNAREAMERLTSSRPDSRSTVAPPADPVAGAPDPRQLQPRQIILTTRFIESLPAGLALPPGPAGSYVAISVKDTGCGVAPEILPRIFEPFFTTKALSARRGTGLGLSMVYELAKKLEAGLNVETVVGQGSTFTIILPVARSQSILPQPFSKA